MFVHDPVDEKNAHTVAQIPEGNLALPALSKAHTQQSKPEKRKTDMSTDGR